MHLIQFREIMRDAEVAYAIHPIMRKYRLSAEDTTKALNRVRRAAGYQRSSDYEHLDMRAVFNRAQESRRRRQRPGC